MIAEIIFLVTESAEGGFEARALGHSIFTEGDTESELRERVRDAVACHFEEAEPLRPLDALPAAERGDYLRALVQRLATPDSAISAALDAVAALPAVRLIEGDRATPTEAR